MHLKSPIVRAALRLGGALVFAASLYFIYEAIVALQPGERLARLDRLQIFAIFSYSVLYAASLSLLAIAWNEVARADVKVDRCAPVIAYGRSVLAKYLPGSIFQYASRQVFGAAAGFDQKRMALSSMAEIILHVLISAIIACALIVITGAWLLPALGVLAVSTLALSLFLRRQVTGLRSAAILQFCFFLMFAGLAILVAYPLADTFSSAITLSGLFLAAWLIGFLVPFAPGGIGVREAALLALGAPIADPGTLLSFAAFTRLVTLGGDLWFGFACYFAPTMLDRLNRQASLRQ